MIAYYTGATGNTLAFIEKLGHPYARIRKDFVPTRPYVLFTPTYTGVPAPVVRLLNNPQSRALLRGVVGSGNMNFGPDFGRAARIVSFKCQVPLLHLFQLSGTERDVQIVLTNMEALGFTHDRLPLAQ